MGIVNSNYSLSTLVSLDGTHYFTSLRHFGDLKSRGKSTSTIVKEKKNITWELTRGFNSKFFMLLTSVQGPPR